MKQPYKELYTDMLADIERQSDTVLPEEERVASCFWVAKNYWEHLKNHIKDKAFESDAEEIDFFRNVKPKFTSRIKYFYMLSEILLFIHPDMEEQRKFWKQQAVKYKRFCDGHKEFVDYYERGATFRNEIYFKKIRDELNCPAMMAFFDNDVDFCSTHDWLIRDLLALRMYYNYVREKLKQLSGK